MITKAPDQVTAPLRQVAIVPGFCDPAPALSLELDTDSVEQAIRSIALNGKNASFAGGDEGVGHWAIYATLIECCKIHNVEPNAYLSDVLTRLVNGHLQSRLSELTPWVN